MKVMRCYLPVLVFMRGEPIGSSLPLAALMKAAFHEVWPAVSFIRTQSPSSESRRLSLFFRLIYLEIALDTKRRYKVYIFHLPLWYTFFKFDRGRESTVLLKQQCEQSLRLQSTVSLHSKKMNNAHRYQRVPNELV